ncbi:MFS transporter [Coxiella burnetii]|uniref:MFS transporter n=1 Tax=Coxiella burnetii TaxID=777 RepID=UPI000183CD7E|nr:MFS transporter [Coxiella burnetii]ACJ18790.1 transporter, MFS superfamily [Coxiella burnetii CbuG_Q212]ATN67162.1 MFS transporter [Coxiella burnetii]OYK85763.1 MFS transporter [Coxiella burnetii]
MRSTEESLKAEMNLGKPALASRYYAWVVLSLCALFLFYKYVLQVSPSVMTTELMRQFHLNGAGLGNLAASFLYPYLIAQLFVGPLLDRYNPRLLTAMAIALCGLGAIFFAHAQTLKIALLARALMGVGVSFATLSYLKMTAIWFKPKLFAFVSGLLATGAMLGSMAGQAPLAWLVSEVGWQMSLYYCGLFGLVLALLFYACVKNKYPSNSSVSTEPTIKLRDIIQLLKLKHNWLLMFYSGLAFSPLAVLGGLWGTTFEQTLFNLNKPEAASLTSSLFLGLAVGAPVLGWLSSRFNKHFAIMWIGLILSLVGLLCALYLPVSIGLEGSSLFLFGFGTGAFMQGFTLGKFLNSVWLTASVVALINTGDALFGSFTEPLIGKFLDLSWQGKTVNGVRYFSIHDFHQAFAVLPLYLCAAFVFLFFLNKTPSPRLHGSGNCSPT